MKSSSDSPARAQFIARGMASLEAAKRDGDYVTVTVAEVIDGLRAKLVEARARMAAKRDLPKR
jgi:hypothetical protein